MTLIEETTAAEAEGALRRFRCVGADEELQVSVLRLEDVAREGEEPCLQVVGKVAANRELGLVLLRLGLALMECPGAALPSASPLPEPLPELDWRVTALGEEMLDGGDAEDWGMTPSDYLAVTGDEQQTREMKQRVRALYGEALAGSEAGARVMTVGTGCDAARMALIAQVAGLLPAPRWLGEKQSYAPGFWFQCELLRRDDLEERATWRAVLENGTPLDLTFGDYPLPLPLALPSVASAEERGAGV